MRCIHDVRLDKECYYCNNGVDKPKEDPVPYQTYKDLLEAYNELKSRMEGLEK